MKISVHLVTTTTRQDPGSCLQWAYIVDDTLHQQPMRTGHMTQAIPSGPIVGLPSLMVSPNHRTVMEVKLECPVDMALFGHANTCLI